jgi:hypothetical protein
MSTGPIPWTAINHYCQRYNIKDEDFETFTVLIRAMDEEFLVYSKELNDRCK